jgi:hypothetical protein
VYVKILPQIIPGEVTENYKYSVRIDGLRTPSSTVKNC